MEVRNYSLGQVRAREPAVKCSRVYAWRELTLVEFKRFLGLLFLTGLVWKYSLESYWSKEEAIGTPYFGTVMARNRFQLIWRFLHFTDYNTIDTSDPLSLIRPVLDPLLASFKQMYQPDINISIDEGTLLWRGQLKFKVYNPMKPIKYGIKSYILSESKTGYLYAMKPYCGVSAHLPDTIRFL